MAKQEPATLFGQDSVPPAAARAAGKGVIVREVACKTLLNHCAIDDYSFNPYTGCANGCVYCYARFMQRFHPHDEPWGRFVDVKANAADVLARQLRRLEPGSVFTCSACDGWQGAERHYELTRRCCRMLLEAGFRLRVLTKCELVLRDLDLFRSRDVTVGVTITTPDDSQARLWEPGASTVAARVGVLTAAKAAGLKTTISFAPLLPGVGDSAEVLSELFALAARAGVDRVWTDALNPRPRVWPSVRGFLQRHRRDLLPLYEKVLFDAEYRTAYVEELNRRIRRAAAEAGLADRLA
jgi:DNA repair photolyase